MDLPGESGGTKEKPLGPMSRNHGAYGSIDELCCCCTFSCSEGIFFLLFYLLPLFFVPMIFYFNFCFLSYRYLL